MSDWQPSAAIEALKARQQLNQSIRRFFAEREVMEVETPVLSQAAVMDPNIEPMCTVDGRYLQTSPEYPMKRLLCAGSGDIYQIARVFRRGEAGHKHNPEFSMLEWYRLNWDHQQLMREVAELAQRLLSGVYGDLPVVYLTYQQAMQQYAGIDGLTASMAVIQQKGVELAGHDLQLTRDGWLDIIMSHAVEPNLPAHTLVFIEDFPASQAALARVIDNGQEPAVARRFELYFNGTELANGYHELTDAKEQRHRFEQEAGGRPMDENLLAALQAGMPDCAGVAMGLDRILMLQLEVEHIADVLAFAWPQA